MTSELPQIVLSGPQLEALELVLSGALGAVDGYCLPARKPDDWPFEARLLIAAGDVRRISGGAELVLSDSDNTPLAVVAVDETLASDDGGLWVAGRVEPQRNAEHGIARDRRLSGSTDFSDHLVAVCGPGVLPSEILRAASAANNRPIDLMAVGTSDAAASARLVSELEECAALLPGATVWFLPSVDLGTDEDVAAALAVNRGATELLDFRRRGDAPSERGAVLLFTGLSGSGKSTIARGLAERIAETGAHQAVLLDGDHVRHELASELGFGADDRDKNLRRIAWVAARVSEGGGLAICAPIAPFAASRAAMRAKVEPQSLFLVVYVSTPLAVAEQRDRKGLYGRARAGLITDFTGIDSPYEEPFDADLVIDTSQLTVEECVDRVIDLLAGSNIIGPAHSAHHMKHL